MVYPHGKGGLSKYGYFSDKGGDFVRTSFTEPVYQRIQFVVPMRKFDIVNNRRKEQDKFYEVQSA